MNAKQRRKIRRRLTRRNKLVADLDQIHDVEWSWAVVYENKPGAGPSEGLGDAVWVP